MVLALLSLTIFVTITYEILPIGLLTPIVDQVHVDEQGAGMLVGGALAFYSPQPLDSRFDARATVVLLGVLTLSCGLIAIRHQRRPSRLRRRRSRRDAPCRPAHRPAARMATLATMVLIVTSLAGLLLGGGSVPFSVAAVIAWGVALGAFPVLSQILAIRASHEVPAAAAPMINTTFNIGITIGSALGGLTLTASNTTCW